ncbi:flavodoxin-like protein [Glaciihabitans tibetensis]|uniref:Flavodoxin-like protein n=1 Tax=Glaciihabitans tibetensis TaxID=1266600 RepID=A0A2T0VHL3_9MICO|nr:flavodoxin domain-containing protein [Glaciihabitans tibetensis]PRY69563.1 flavodoxin-like protein [Glaciihabitans tibetensis]
MAKGGTVKTVVLYESMFGATRKIAEAIAEGARTHSEVTVVPLADQASASVAGADLIIVGAPTHALTMPTAASRKQAVEWTEDPKKDLELDNGAPETGVKEWLENVPASQNRYATFDTRTGLMSHFPGSAAAQIDKALHKRRMTRIARPESFVVENSGALRVGEEARATQWGAAVAGASSAAGAVPA